MGPRYDAERRDVTSKNIDGISDLVVWAPIKEGFIEAFVNMTYESRLRLVAEALHNVRKSAREYELLEPYADTAKRILSLLDFRIGIVDRDIYGASQSFEGQPPTLRPRKYMYLVATFDGPWEPYMRLIWRPLGYFLDLILCNCDDYKPAADSDFETYAKWVRDNQLDSAIFYSTSGLTVEDAIYLSDLEDIQLNNPAAFSSELIASHSISHPDDAAKRVRDSYPVESQLLGAEALNVLYKLADLYPPISKGEGLGDGRFLIKAAQELLAGFEPRRLSSAAQVFLQNQIRWFETEVRDTSPTIADPPFIESEIQKGILSGYDTSDQIITHGALLLSRISDAKLFRKFLPLIQWSWEGDSPSQTGSIHFGSGVFLNIAFSYRGLERLGLSEDELLNFPKEFRQGMQERATLIGDKFQNHPRNWNLPLRNWPNRSEKLPPIETAEIEFVIQIRASLQETVDPHGAFYKFSVAASDVKEDVKSIVDQILAKSKVKTNRKAQSKSTRRPKFDDRFFDRLREELPPLQNGRKPTRLDAVIDVLSALGDEFGFVILGIEDMYRPDAVAPRHSGAAYSKLGVEVTDHFGFKDGISQPKVVNEASELSAPNDILKGDILYGYQNTRNDYHLPQTVNSLMHNGSFMVVRKIAQDRAALDELEAKHGEQLVEKIVGRTRDGKSFIPDRLMFNDFSFDEDPKGVRCPLSAHIRLANPRSEAFGRRSPKILRRGMSYGHTYEDGKDDDRGIVFIGYCASLAEQYEVIQRWLNAGNATGISSRQNDPLTGVVPRGKNRVFRCFVNQKIEHVDIDKPLTRLEWGEYFFVPSKSALKALTKKPKETKTRSVKTGQKIIDQISELEPEVQRQEWKRLLEDYLTREPTKHDLSSKVWAAIQRNHNGALRLPNGIRADDGSPDNETPVVLVTDPTEIMKVFKNKPRSKSVGCPFSTSEQLARCSGDESFGAIYVAIDEDVEPYPANLGKYGSYAEEAYPANSILMAYSRETAFYDGYNAGKAYLKTLQSASNMRGAYKIELGTQYIQPVLAKICSKWFGLPDPVHFAAGAWNWDLDGKPKCPGDFLAPSRHAFYPRPTDSIAWIGNQHGAKLKSAIKAYVDDHWDNKGGMPGAVVTEMHLHLRKKAKTDPQKTDYYKDLLGRNIIGIMVGALPPMEGNLRSIFFEGLEEKKLWQWQNAFNYEKSKSPSNTWVAANVALTEPIKSAICVRPAPDLLYRTVKNGPIEVGGTVAEAGDTVIMCLSAATQAALRKGKPDVSLVFGGDRKNKKGKSPMHACPAQDMAMGAMTGILAALFEAGQIKALPASLIVEVSGWEKF